jgi:hypothetical protein
MATNISNNIFTGVKWNKSSIQTVQTVAQALLNITEVFKSQNINFTLLRVDNAVEKDLNVEDFSLNIDSNGSLNLEPTDKTTDSGDGTDVEQTTPET